MSMHKLFPSSSRSKAYMTFESNVMKLAYFLGTTEKHYDKQVRILGKQVREASQKLPHAEIELDELLQKADSRNLSKVEERYLAELDERIYDLMDIDLFAGLQAKLFRQFRELIRVLGFSYLVTVFEGYLADIIREILLAKPEALKSAKEISTETVLSLGGRQQIVSHLAEREVDELLYRSFPDVVKYFDKKFSINVNASPVSSAQIVEIMATRNIHVHNGGLVNRRYLQLVKCSKLKPGAYRPITRAYLADSINSIRSLVGFIDAEVQKKYFAKQNTGTAKASSE